MAQVRVAHIVDRIEKNSVNPPLWWKQKLRKDLEAQGLEFTAEWAAELDKWVVKDQHGREWFHFTQEQMKEVLHPKVCPNCRGYRWFDDLGFVASGQPAFSFTPCPDCNPQGDRQMWGNEPGDPGYVPGPDHRFRLIMADQTVEDPYPKP